MEFNEKLQKLRKQRGLTQEELAEKLYVTRTAVSKWESGRGYPNIDSLLAIAKFFSVTIDELLSSGEAIRLAEEDRREKSEGSRDLICGLIDISACLLLFLPIFALRTGEVIKNTALLFLNGTPLYILIPYFTLVTATVLCGIATLLMRGRKTSLWRKLKAPFSISLSGAAALIFTITLQPYAAVFALTLLTIKALTLIFHK